MSGWATFFSLTGGLGLFLYGMDVMSSGIQKSAGNRMRNIMNRLTSNRIAGVFTGMMVTGIIQSSSATTVMLVSLVNAELVSLVQAIGVIMGANIGTTMTAWIVALLGFKMKITMLAMPAIALSMPFFFSKYEKRRDIARGLLGFGILFLGLHMMKESVPDLSAHPNYLSFVQTISNYGFFSVLLFVLIGTLVTIAVQSSSAAMAITIMMAYAGWIGYEAAVAIVLGENIGTTVTANLAAMGMSTNAKRAALAHTVFNSIGVLWVLVLFYPFIHMVDALVPGDITDPATLPIHLSMFHTMFNITNTFVMIWFVPQIANLVTRILPMHEKKSTKGYKLPMAPAHIPDAAESNLITARAELGKFSQFIHAMLLRIMNLTDVTDPEQIERVKDEMCEEETQTDIMQEVIARFLMDCTTDGMSDRQIRMSTNYQRIAHELESIADSCLNIAFLFARNPDWKAKLHKKAPDQFMNYISLVLDFLNYNSDFAQHQLKNYDFNIAVNLEVAINQKRDQLQRISRRKLEKGADVRSELFFLDVVRHLEHIGDYSLNIAQAIRELDDN
ncbi:MAG: Na/Pi cotransporter family protein [Spartobacteria bacterium]|nr:Na/Pi cotransporter family protein [Spartobacteria bacterium]